MPAWIRDRLDYGWVRALWRATPCWLTDEQRADIREVYREAQDRRATVDHIVPLRGEGVCGLHVPWNLQVATWAEQREKSNLYWPGGPERLRLDLDHEPQQMTLI